MKWITKKRIRALCSNLHVVASSRALPLALAFGVGRRGERRARRHVFYFYIIWKTLAIVRNVFIDDRLKRSELDLLARDFRSGEQDTEGHDTVVC